MTDVREELARYFHARLALTPAKTASSSRRDPAPYASLRRRRMIAAVLTALIVVIGGLRSVLAASTDPRKPLCRHLRETSTERSSCVPRRRYSSQHLELGSTRAFVIIDRRLSSVVATNVQHLPRPRRLCGECPNERLFAAPLHGEAFSEDGTVLGGPAQRGLEHLTVEVRAGHVTARLDEIRLSAPRGPNAVYDAQADHGTRALGRSAITR